MPVRHGLGKGIERLVGQMNQQTFEPAVEPRIGQRRGGGNLRGPQRGGQGTRQGAKRGRYHTEPPSRNPFGHSIVGLGLVTRQGAAQNCGEYSPYWVQRSQTV